MRTPRHISQQYVADRRVPDLYKLIEGLMELPPEKVNMTALPQVCMCPNKPCNVCYFHESRWCLPHERQAKAMADLRRFIELEHSTSIEEAHAATMEAYA